LKRTTTALAQANSPEQHSFDYYYYRFKRAKCEDTLNIMYKGAVEKASVPIKESEKSLKPYDPVEEMAKMLSVIK